jgi:ADP-ribose pyrophosphatase YjhB (NUDIX family)
LITAQIGWFYAIIQFMNAPKLVVTVVLFTVVEDFNLYTVPISLLSVGRSSERFGMGLFAVTRKSIAERRALPSRAVGFEESVNDAAQKLISEDLGISAPVRLRQNRIFDNPTREQGERVISITYWGFANLEDVAPVLGGKEQVGLELVNSSNFLDGLSGDIEQYDGISRFGGRYAPGEKRGHDLVTSRDLGAGPVLDIDHDEMVLLSWRELRHAFGGKLDPFRFLGATALPEAFRLSDLRELQDVCRGERSQVDQFRRSVLNESSFISESLMKEERQKRPGKPAMLYSLRDWADPSKLKMEDLDTD